MLRVALTQWDTAHHNYVFLSQVDYLERAKRLVEIPLLHGWHEEQRTAGKQFHEEQQEADVRNSLYCILFCIVFSTYFQYSSRTL